MAVAQGNLKLEDENGRGKMKVGEKSGERRTHPDCWYGDAMEVEGFLVF